MLQKNKIDAFVDLGNFLRQFALDKTIKNTQQKSNDLFFDDFSNLIALSQHHNGWFTAENVYFSIQSWAEALTEEKITNWLKNYTFKENETKTIGLILAGNIPLVGFHDFLTVLLSGNKVLVKTSSNDQKLLPFLANYLKHIEPIFNDYIFFIDGKLENFDAVIATGSNNTARYFDYYFKDKPSIIRKNRNSVAVLTGKETKTELTLLGEDIFRYFGLGCRNVSKLFVPQNYDFTLFFEAIFEFSDIINYEKYANNYDYNKAVFLMSLFKLRDNGFLTLKEDESYASPISSVFYEFYDNLDTILERLNKDSEKLQCVVSNLKLKNHVYFGETQKPKLSDYADNVDTMAFLIGL